MQVNRNGGWHRWRRLACVGVCCAAVGGWLPPARPADTDWAMKGFDNSDVHYSPLNDINAATVNRLGLVWSLDLPGEHSLAGTPLEVEGTLYFSGQNSTVYAVDVSSGKLLWRYDPMPWRAGTDRLRLVYPVNRGIAYDRGRVFVGTHDGRLIALDAKNGATLWSVETFDSAKSRRFIAGPPRVLKDLVVIGNGGGDYGERGYVTAYDTTTGAQRWRFYTAPGEPNESAGDPVMTMAASTWSGEYWKTGTGGTVWHGITYDKELNQLYLGTGNSGPYNPDQRSPGNGDNLFLVSIVALNPDTGKYIWHYQMNPREAWDYKATADMILADLTIDGRARKVLMQAPTNGFFYVIDRQTGKVLSAAKLGKVTWAERIDLSTGRPVEAPNIRYEKGETTIWPSSFGAHNWQSMSYSPRTGLVYIPYMQLGARYRLDPKSSLGSVSVEFVVDDENDGTGKLLAWDPVEQVTRWSVRRTGLWNGGTMSTGGGVVFQGTGEGVLEAFDSRNGHKLWSFDAKLGIISTPITYKVNGKQYVSVLVGYGAAAAPLSGILKSGWKYGAQPRRLLTFALDGKARLPETAPRDFTLRPVDDSHLNIDDAAAARGAALYSGRGVCFICHGVNVSSPGSPAPDLRESAVALSYGTFSSALKKGDRAPAGMPSFSELSDDDIRDLFMYIRAAAREALLKKGFSSRSQGAGRM